VSLVYNKKQKIKSLNVIKITYNTKFLFAEVYKPFRLAIIVCMKPTIVKEKVTLKAIERVVNRSIERSVAKLATKDEMNKSIDDLAGAVKKGFDEVHEKFAKIDEKFVKIDERFEHIDSRFGQIDSRFGQMEKRFDEMDDQFKEVNLKFDGVTEQFEKMSKQIKQSDLKIDGLARRIQGVNNSLDAHTNICVRRDEFGSLESRMKILETA